jgi:cellulose biosynthesis protein BcsQ
MLNLVVVNTKGGVGKTNIALNILPVLLQGKNITYYQLDNNNKLSVRSDFVNIKEFKLNNLNEALSEIEFSDNDVNIIDAGGGDDVKLVLQEVANSILDDVRFIIPVSKNLSIRYNIEDTLKHIYKNFKNPKVYLMFNFLENINDYKKEYINIFGDEVFEIEPLKELDKFQKEFGFVINSSLFQILELNKEILLDRYLKVKELAENKNKLLKVKKEELKDLVKKKEIKNEEAHKRYLTFRNKIRQAEEIEKVIKDLKSINKNIITELTK